MRAKATVYRAERLAPLPGVISTEGTAWAQGRETDAENAREQRAALEAEAQTWRLRITGASPGDDARDARKLFAHDNGDALIAQMAPEIAEACDGYERALRGHVGGSRGVGGARGRRADPTPAPPLAEEEAVA